jgi:hypothetical protein
MATTVRDVCTKAFRKLGVLRAGGEMRAADAEDARASLQSFYLECISKGSFGRVQDIAFSRSGTFTSGTNQHIIVVTEDEVQIDLPSTLPADCWWNWKPWRDYGWGLNIPMGGDPSVAVPRDRSVVSVTSQYSDIRATYIYDGTAQRWMRVDVLELNDEAPLSARGADGLAAVLAIRLSEEFGSSLISPVTLQAANSYKTALVTHYGVGDDCYC